MLQTHFNHNQKKSIDTSPSEEKNIEFWKSSQLLYVRLKCRDWIDWLFSWAWNQTLCRLPHLGVIDILHSCVFPHGSFFFNIQGNLLKCCKATREQLWGMNSKDRVKKHSFCDKTFFCYRCSVSATGSKNNETLWTDNFLRNCSVHVLQWRIKCYSRLGSFCVFNHRSHDKYCCRGDRQTNFREISMPCQPTVNHYHFPLTFLKDKHPLTFGKRTVWRQVLHQIQRTVKKQTKHHCEPLFLLHITALV